jgi:hypothetical protein
MVSVLSTNRAGCPFGWWTHLLSIFSPIILYFLTHAGKKKIFFLQIFGSLRFPSVLAAEAGASVTVTETRTECTTEVEI